MFPTVELFIIYNMMTNEGMAIKWNTKSADDGVDDLSETADEFIDGRPARPEPVDNEELFIDNII